MTYKISQIPVHDTNPARTNMVESEQAGGTSVYSSIDEILNPIMPPTTQIQGYTIANVAEVEAATKALRATLRPGDIAFGADQSFAVSRHVIGAQCSIATTTAAINGAVLAAMWTFNGIALLKKCTVSVVTAAFSGTRTGTIECHLRKNWPAINTIALTSDILPPISAVISNQAAVVGGNPAPGNIYSSLNIQQPQPLMVIATSVVGINPNPIVTSGVEFVSRAMASAVGGARAAVETNIPPTALFDCAQGGYEPYVMIGNTGFVVDLLAPAASVSQTMNVSVNLQWDEWIPIPADY